MTFFQFRNFKIDRIFLKFNAYFSMQIQIERNKHSFFYLFNSSSFLFGKRVKWCGFFHGRYAFWAMFISLNSFIEIAILF